MGKQKQKKMMMDICHDIKKTQSIQCFLQKHASPLRSESLPNQPRIVYLFFQRIFPNNANFVA